MTLEQALARSATATNCQGDVAVKFLPESPEISYLLLVQLPKHEGFDLSFMMGWTQTVEQAKTRFLTLPFAIDPNGWTALDFLQGAGA